MLLALKGMGANFAAVLWSEAFYRQFSNAARSPPMRALRRRPGRAGASGTSRACRRPQSKAADHDDPDRLALDTSPAAVGLTRWFKERSPQGRKRAIVALARKLLVALWKYVTQGVVIEGAVMKPAA